MMYKKFFELHRFFVIKSPQFMSGTSRLKYLIYYPVAYVKFMWLGLGGA